MEPKDVRKIIDAGGTMKHTPWITLGDTRKARCPFCGSTKLCQHFYWDNGTSAAFVGFEKESK